MLASRPIRKHRVCLRSSFIRPSSRSVFKTSPGVWKAVLLVCLIYLFLPPALNPKGYSRGDRDLSCSRHWANGSWLTAVMVARVSG